MTSPSASPVLLAVTGLAVEFRTTERVVVAVRGASFTVGRGETVAIVGESGSGKSVTSFAVMRILDRAGRIAEGSIAFTGLEPVETVRREIERRCLAEQLGRDRLADSR